MARFDKKNRNIQVNHQYSLAKRKNKQSEHEAHRGGSWDLRVGTEQEQRGCRHLQMVKKGVVSALLPTVPPPNPPGPVNEIAPIKFERQIACLFDCKCQFVHVHVFVHVSRMCRVSRMSFSYRNLTQFQLLYII